MTQNKKMQHFNQYFEQLEKSLCQINPQQVKLDVHQLYLLILNYTFNRNKTSWFRCYHIKHFLQVASQNIFVLLFWHRHWHSISCSLTTKASGVKQKCDVIRCSSLSTCDVTKPPRTSVKGLVHFQNKNCPDNSLTPMSCSVFLQSKRNEGVYSM